MAMTAGSAGSSRASPASTSTPSKPGPTNSPPGVTGDAIEGAALLTKAQGRDQDATAIILRQCEKFLQTGEVTPLMAEELKDAMAESQSRPDLTRSPLFPLVAD